MKVPPGGVRARCSVCGAVIRVGMEGAAVPTPAPASGAVPSMGSARAANERAVMESDAEAAPEAFDPPAKALAGGGESSHAADSAHVHSLRNPLHSATAVGQRQPL